MDLTSQDLEYIEESQLVGIIGKWLARNINSATHTHNISFCKCPGELPLKNTQQNTLKKIVITLICKLICTKTDWPCGDTY